MNKRACCVFILITTFLSILFFSTSFDDQNLIKSAFLRWENQNEESALFDYNNRLKIWGAGIYPILLNPIIGLLDQLTSLSFQRIPTNQRSIVLRC
jgi:hypothetical protein